MLVAGFEVKYAMPVESSPRIGQITRRQIPILEVHMNGINN